MQGRVEDIHTRLTDAKPTRRENIGRIRRKVMSTTPAAAAIFSPPSSPSTSACSCVGDVRAMPVIPQGGDGGNRHHVPRRLVRALDLQPGARQYSRGYISPTYKNNNKNHDNSNSTTTNTVTLTIFMYISITRKITPTPTTTATTTTTTTSAAAA